MVWGMNHPPVSNGAFYLAGEFEGAAPVASNGWRQRLSRYFIDEMSDVQQAVFQDENNAGAHWYACHAVGKFLIRPEWRGRERGPEQAAIRDHEIPAFFQSTGNFDKLAAMAQFAGPVLTVNQALKDLIEWIEPGVHGLYPVEVRRAKNKPPIGMRYILVVNRMLDSFSEVHSQKASFTISDDRRRVDHVEKPTAMRKLAFRKDVIGEAHLWHEMRMSQYLLCMSDRMQQEIADLDLIIPRHAQMAEV
jgi:hypothetical protein